MPLWVRLRLDQQPFPKPIFDNLVMGPNTKQFTMPYFTKMIGMLES
jgi:formylmethanofuran dehydrogenase subunit D